ESTYENTDDSDDHEDNDDDCDPAQYRPGAPRSNSKLLVHSLIRRRVIHWRRRRVVPYWRGIGLNWRRIRLRRTAVTTERLRSDLRSATPAKRHSPHPPMVG